MKFNLSFHTCKVNIGNYFEQQIRMIVVCFIRVIQNHSQIDVHFSLKKRKQCIREHMKPLVCSIHRLNSRKRFTCMPLQKVLSFFHPLAFN